MAKCTTNGLGLVMRTTIFRWKVFTLAPTLMFHCATSLLWLSLSSAQTFVASAALQPDSNPAAVRLTQAAADAAYVLAQRRIQGARETQATFLDLGSLGLKTIPPEIGQLENLKTLILKGNELTHLPAELGQLENLTRLELHGNQLTRLPVVLGQLKTLEKLDLKGNELTNLSAELSQLKNLTQLNLDGNQLTTLPVEIGQLTNLEDLNLSRNPLTSVPAELGQQIGRASCRERV